MLEELAELQSGPALKDGHMLRIRHCHLGSVAMLMEMYCRRSRTAGLPVNEKTSHMLSEKYGLP